MSEFINRKQFIAATQSLHCETCDHRIDCLLCNVGRVIRKIKNFPSADVAPVVHGKWVEPSYKRKKAGICGSTDAMAGKCRCSVCRHEEPVFEEYPKYNYCPYCGAKMDESEDNNNV